MKTKNMTERLAAGVMAGAVILTAFGGTAFAAPENAPVRGFAQKKTIYKDGENPFTDGTCRFIPTERKKKKNKTKTRN